MTAAEILKIIENDTNRDQHVVWGLRSIPSKSADVTVGQALDNSYIWDDGVCTDDELDGVCAIHLGDPYYDDIAEYESRAICDCNRGNRVMQGKDVCVHCSIESRVAIGG